MAEPDSPSLIGVEQLLLGLRLSGRGSQILLTDGCRNSPNQAQGRAFGSNKTTSDLPVSTAIFACRENDQAFEDESWRRGAPLKRFLDLLPLASCCLGLDAVIPSVLPKAGLILPIFKLPTSSVFGIAGVRFVTPGRRLPVFAVVAGRHLFNPIVMAVWDVMHRWRFAEAGPVNRRRWRPA